ncbi:hypothetical protein CHUAL_004111 [Chamberlinius hualienensis]
MSRKVGLGDTHFDADIDGDVDFEFFGGIDLNEENQSANQNDDLLDCNINNTLTNNNDSSANQSSNELNTFDQMQHTKSVEIEAIATTSNSQIIVGGIDAVNLSVKLGEAENLLQQEQKQQEEETVKKSVDENFTAFEFAHDTATKVTDNNDDTVKSNCDSHFYKGQQMSDNSASSSTTTAATSSINDDDDDDMSAIDMKFLSKAVSDLQLQDNKQRLIESRSSGRQLTRLSTSVVSRPRKNMTFSNDEVRRIDMENKFLLRKIIEAQKPRNVLKKSQTPLVASSTINRMRDFKKIESENLMLLKKLQAVKPTKSLCRDNLVGPSSRTVVQRRTSSNLDSRSRSNSLLSTNQSELISSSSRLRTRASSNSSLPTWGTPTESGSYRSSETSSTIGRLPKLIKGKN